jgi:single-strand DNA-binding protein
MLNQTILIGRLAHDPEVKILEDGRKVTDITLAVSRPFKNMDGNYDTDFIKITVWEGLANSIESYAHKGVLIAVKARVQTWKLEITEEKKINMIEIIADRITFLSGNGKLEEKKVKESSEK